MVVERRWTGTREGWEVVVERRCTGTREGWEVVVERRWTDTREGHRKGTREGMEMHRSEQDLRTSNIRFINRGGMNNQTKFKVLVSIHS